MATQRPCQRHSFGPVPTRSVLPLPTGTSTCGVVNLRISRLVLVVAVLAFGAFLGGCSNSSEGDPNYSTKVDLTPEQKAKIAEDKKNQAPPGTLETQPGQVRSEPEGGLKVPGKGH